MLCLEDKFYMYLVFVYVLASMCVFQGVMHIGCHLGCFVLFFESGSLTDPGALLDYYFHLD